ncbi:FUSC family protein [Pseudomonas capeferrum]|uniref:FUSC family protein n=1 Tax=Pseudomonas capeferrum TaxID=1495066 RepID=UPI0015E324E5|nr:FUSC family protein [Pseudomonas capeferrum]MBA1204396.1 FUSC family protein [Pseudomonas capeferrum]
MGQTSVTMAPGALLFSIKLFIAAMLSFVIAVKIGLPQPYWAVVTCCVVMNPMTGAIRSKAVYRFSGTLCAGVVTLAMVGLFASTPLLLIVASGLVATAAFGCAFLDRTPRSYGFQLFAITLMLVAVAGVDHPETMFDTVIARICEICIGITLSTLVDSLIAPRSLANTLRSNLHRWLADVESWIVDVLEGKTGDSASTVAHHRLQTVRDITSLSLMLTQLHYDPTVPRQDIQYALAIQQRLLRLVPLLSAIETRITALGADEASALAPSLAEALNAIRAGDTAAKNLSENIYALPLMADEQQPWQLLVHENLAELLTQLLAIWSEVRTIDAALDGARTLDPALQRQVGNTIAFALAPDKDLALRIAAAILTTYVLLCSLWAATGWHQGPNTVLLGTVALAFFGGGDEPGRAISMFGRFGLLSLTLVGFLCYGLLPLAHDFPTFVLMMGIFMLPLGVWAATNPMAILILALGLSSINLQGQYTPLDFASFLESVFANLLGIYTAFLCSGLFRTLGAKHALSRFVRMETLEISQLTQKASQKKRDAYLARTLDRISSITARLAAAGQIDRSVRLLTRLSVGVHVAELNMASPALNSRLRISIEHLLDRVRMEIDRPQPSNELLALIDGTLTLFWHQRPTLECSNATQALVGLRVSLFAQSPAWVPAP